MTYVTYSQHGPFTNGAAPGIDQSFLNAVESFLLAGWFDSAITSNHAGILTVVGLIIGSGLLQLTSKSAVKSGSTSGTMTVYEFMTGTGSLKVVWLDMNNYRNAAASANNIALNAPFTNGAIVATSDVPGLQFLASSSPQSFSSISSLGGSGSGSLASTSTINKACLAGIRAFDTISEPGGNGSAHTGNLLAIGI